MGFLIGAVVVGLVLTLVLMRVLYVIVSRAVDNTIRWTIYNFGNEDAVRRMREIDSPDDPAG